MAQYASVPRDSLVCIVLRISLSVPYLPLQTTLYRIRNKARESLRASKLSEYYMSDASSAFSPSAFCPPEQTQSMVSEDAAHVSGTMGQSCRTEAQGSAESFDIRTEIDKPMEELLILFGATRLHTGDEKGKRGKGASCAATPENSNSIPIGQASLTSFGLSASIPVFADPEVLEKLGEAHPLAPMPMSGEIENSWKSFMEEISFDQEQRGNAEITSPINAFRSQSDLY